jgi:prepilin-type N-terminal cleavage/methylation domain-containing protein
MKKIRLILKVNASNRGFTLVEILIAVAIMGILATILSMAITQIVMVNASSNNHMKAITQVENALHYINRDVQEAQTINPINYDLVSGNKLTINWTDWNDNTAEVEYWITNGNLNKKQTMTPNSGSPTITQSVVASYITAARCDWDSTSKTFTLKITSVLPGFPNSGEERTLIVRPRSAQ